MALCSVIGCYGDHDRDGRDAAWSGDAPREAVFDAGGPRMLEERCEIAWVREVPIPSGILGLVGDLAVVGGGADERVVSTLYAGRRFATEDGAVYDAGQYLGVFDAENGAGRLTPTRVGDLAASGDRLFAAVGDDPDPAVPRVRFVELDPRDGRERRSLGTVWADAIFDLEVVSSGERSVISFGVFEAFGTDALEPRLRGSSVVLLSDGVGLGVLGSDARLGALVALPEGPTLLAAPDSQLCAAGVCLGSPGNRHVVVDGRRVVSSSDRDRLEPARPRAALGRSDGTWLELDGLLTRHDAGGSVLATVEVPYRFNVFELDGDETRIVTHTRIEAGPARRITSDVSLPPVDATSELYIAWDAATLTPLHFATIAVAPEERSGLHTLVVGASGRSYVAGIADPSIEVCGRTFEHSILVIAFE